MDVIEPGKHVCIVTTAKVNQQNPIYVVHEVICLVLVVDKETGAILDCDVNVVCELTRKFIKAIFESRNLLTDIPEIQSCVSGSYFGASAKAIVTATKLARGKLLEIQGKVNREHFIMEG